MRHHHRIGWFSVFAILVVAAAPVIAMRMAAPVGVRITAYVNEKPDDFHPEYTWVVAHHRDEIRLHIEKVLVQSPVVSASDIDEAVSPYPVNFNLAGQDAALKKLTSASAGEKLTISAYIEFAQGVRILMLDTVEAATQPTPATKSAGEAPAAQ